MTVARLCVPPVDAVEDLVGDPLRAELVLLMNGNQFMVMEELLARFREHEPGVGEVFYETLPPGILAAQLRSGTLQLGTLWLSVRADVFAGGPELLAELRRERLVRDGVVYAANELALLVRRDAPVRRLADLAADGLRVAIPNPETEGIGAKVAAALQAAGGESLAARVLEEKRAAGETVLTEIHHRQSPLWLAAGTIDAATVWATEARHQLTRGLDARLVEIPAEHNQTGLYEVAGTADAPHPEAATSFLEFMGSESAHAIYSRHGFRPNWCDAALRG